ncbi:MAG: hypothetical protein AAFR28_18125 [Pseudomonadota bacterium]
MPYPDDYNAALAPDRAPTAGELAHEHALEEADDLRRAVRKAAAEFMESVHVLRAQHDEGVESANLSDLTPEHIAEYVEEYIAYVEEDA